MKRITSMLLVILLCLTLAPTIALPAAEAASGDVAINSTNFPDANFRSYVSDNFDTNGDDVLSAAEIAAVTKMYAGSKSITTLKGVEYFTALTDLYCENNQLTALDVSANTALVSLGCNQNQLTTLDVSDTTLKMLFCESNRLTTLMLGTNLTYLRCNDNRLTALDVSKNTALTELFCYNNQLTALNVRNSTGMTHLRCYGNSIDVLDMT